MPQIAPAARARIVREMRLSPATSTMLGNITMSFTPTYCAVLPLASVETMSLGKPSGSARMPAVAMAVPPPPPSEITPSMRPSACSLARTTGAACDIAATASPRSCRARIAGRSRPASAAASSRETSGATCGGPSGAEIDEQRLVTARADLLGDEGVFVAFGVEGAEESDGGHAGKSETPPKQTEARRNRQHAHFARVR